MKTVTVIIPTYNRWPTVCTAIDSVLAQTYPHTRCLVVDDASSDDTAVQLLEKYGDRIDIIRNQDNRGQSFRRNQGVSASESDYICFLDSDDTLDENSVASRISLIDSDPENIKVCFGIIRKPGRPHSPLTHQKSRGDTLSLEEYLMDMGWCHNNSYLIERDAFLNDGQFNPKLRNREDIELIIRLMCKFGFYYCGEEIGEVRDVCTNRARDNYANILDPANSFAHFIQENPLIRNTLKPGTIHYLISSEVEEQLRAFYRMDRYWEYRNLFRQASRQDQILHTGKFAKRYWLSYIKGLFVRNPLIAEARYDIYHSGEYGQHRTGQEKIIYEKSLEAFCTGHKNLCDRFDELISEGYCYKSDATSTVASAVQPGHNWVIKRYNSKGLSTTLKMLARQPRAERSFIKSLILRNLGISTPRPLIFAVRYKHGLPYNNYIVTQQSPGDTVCNLFDQGKVSRKEWPIVVDKVRKLLNTLHNRSITHGDIKPTNVLLSDGEVEIIDLDSMRLHRMGRLFDHFYNKDLRALEKRISGYIDEAGA